MSVYLKTELTHYRICNTSSSARFPLNLSYISCSTDSANLNEVQDSLREDVHTSYNPVTDKFRPMKIMSGEFVAWRISSVSNAEAKSWRSQI